MVVVALLAAPFARYEWHVWHLHPTCTTANIAVDFSSDGDGAQERWVDMERRAMEGCPPGQWDRSKIDITKI